MSFLPADIRQHILRHSQEAHLPFYVYDLDRMLEHLKACTAQQEVKLWYAVKANPLSAVIQTLNQAGFNFDVASSGELEQVLAQDIPAERILNTGPAKSRRQILHFIQRGVRIFVAESLNQVRWLNEVAAEQGCHLEVLLRVQLRWPNAEKNPLGGDSLTPFGLGTEEWQQLQIANYSQLNFVGLHIFQWGNMLDEQRLTSLWRTMIAPLQQLASQLGFKLKILDLGGGLGIPYLPGERQLDWPTLVEELGQIKREAGVDELWMELGRYAVGPFGHYVNPVVEQKTNYGEHQAILSGGINHILRPTVTNQAFPCQLLRDSPAQQLPFNLHGPLCTALDHLGTHSLPSDLNEQDWIVFSQVGAYGFTESMPFFLCHELAEELIVKEGKLQSLRAPQPASSYLK